MEIIHSSLIKAQSSSGGNSRIDSNVAARIRGNWFHPAAADLQWIKAHAGTMEHLYLCKDPLLEVIRTPVGLFGVHLKYRNI